MIVELTLPRLGETMETGRVAAWLRSPGETFRRGETLLEIETDKTVVEMPALADGTLLEIVAEAGRDADVGAVLCRYEDGRDAGPAVPPTKAEVAPESPHAAPMAMPSEAAPVRATPLARRIARERGVVLADITGSGRRGRIEAADVRGSPPPAAGVRAMNVADGRIASRSWGADNALNPRVVLLHGLGADAQSWAGLAAPLTRAGRHVLALDLPGHGETDMEATTVDAMAAAVAAFLERLGGAAVELAGCSLGGAVAARAAGLAPARVRRLTLLAPIGLDREIDLGFIHGIAGARSAGALRHLFRRLAVRPPAMSAAQLDALVAELSRGRLDALVGTLVDAGGQQVDITGELRALPMPVRVVWGVQDRVIPWTQVSQAGSRAAVHLVQDAGHVPHWDQPAEVAALFE